ncbi:hypothetical protein [Dyadobacter psychrophilus]|uniref:Uncharacterized protein n=1 Tax=Dyadobacter psychrophilus TaxID=651661 RepID=A0A1T5BU55_9BACT|nr:hypothetical protein [Dyadobacter psychrophilus]SKB50671.1 hypothetical protein SAMN05660293_00609 [Dyadobacter psychrophilus]
MRAVSLLICLFIVAVFAGCNHQKADLVNPVIGNISFVEKFGFEPDEATDNELRIKTHLLYVERLLRKKDISHLSDEYKSKRTQVLNLLRSYANAGKYPKNYDYKGERKPCFIDKDQNICAVGYLVEQTAGRRTAEAINADYKYADIFDMEGQTVDKWIAASGLTKDECAMIQPTYGSYPNGDPVSNRVKPMYAISSAVLMGANATFNAVNIIDLAKGGNSKTAPVFGFLAGTSQIAIGAFGFSRDRRLTQYDDRPMFTSQGKLSLFNIGIGTTTILLSSWNLLKQKKMEQKRTSWNIYSFPAGNNQTGLGLSFSRKI